MSPPSRTPAPAVGARQFPTPEGTVISVTLAERTERATALVIDLAFLLGAYVLVIILAYLILKATEFDSDSLAWLLTGFLVISFLLRSFYFTYFELRWQGRTPGKRIMGLRVIDRRGGQLRADAIFTRNLLREIELFLPLQLLLSGGVPSLGGWGNLAMFTWVALFVFLPCFNRNRLRAGDIAAGTWVIRAPKLTLLDDLSADGPRQPGRRQLAQDTATRYHFSPAQLDAYGIYELQMLERVLRDAGSNRADTFRAVQTRIARKIGWDTPAGFRDHQGFLEAYYTALRAHLEHRMLFGERREDKFDRKR